MDQQIELLLRIEAELKTANQLARESLDLQKRAGDSQEKLTAEMTAHIARATEINAGAKLLQQKGIAVTEKAQKIQRFLPIVFGALLLAMIYALYKMSTLAH